nr:hypothetical protein [Tanacetum cinerariifolium]
ASLLFLSIMIPNMISAYLSGRTPSKGTGGCNLVEEMY